MKKGTIDDSVISNNDDIRKVISTVIAVTYAFLEENPTFTIIIIPVDDKRQSVYNYIFRHRFHEIEPSFEVLGYHGDFHLENIGELYQPKNIYDYFSVKLKN